MLQRRHGRRAGARGPHGHASRDKGIASADKRRRRAHCCPSTSERLARTPQTPARDEQRACGCRAACCTHRPGECARILRGWWDARELVAQRALSAVRLGGGCHGRLTGSRFRRQATLAGDVAVGGHSGRASPFASKAARTHTWSAWSQRLTAADWLRPVGSRGGGGAPLARQRGGRPRSRDTPTESSGAPARRRSCGREGSRRWRTATRALAPGRAKTSLGRVAADTSSDGACGV